MATQSEIQQGLLTIRAERERLGKLESAYRVGAELAVLAQRQADVEAEIADRKDQLAELGAQLAAAQAALDGLRADHDVSHAAGVEAAAEAKTVLAQELAAMQDRANDALEADLASLRVEIVASQEHLAALRGHLARVGEETAAARAELARVGAEHAAFLGKVGAAPA